MNNNYYLKVSTSICRTGKSKWFSYGLQIIKYEGFYVKCTDEFRSRWRPVKPLEITVSHCAHAQIRHSESYVMIYWPNMI